MVITSLKLSGGLELGEFSQYKSGHLAMHS